MILSARRFPYDAGNETEKFVFAWLMLNSLHSAVVVTLELVGSKCPDSAF